MEERTSLTDLSSLHLNVDHRIGDRHGTGLESVDRLTGILSRRGVAGEVVSGANDLTPPNAAGRKVG